MSIRNQEMPEFAPALRGYDRLQVDDYLGRLREYALEVEERALNSEAALAGAQQELADLRRQATLSSGGDIPPRLAHILQLAKEEADEVRTRARADADEMTSKAHGALDEARRRARAEGDRIVAEAVAHKKTVERQLGDLEKARDHMLGRLGDFRREIGETIEHFRNGNGNGKRSRPEEETQPVEQGRLKRKAG
jgi:DivIVA domain-containing protein